MNITILGAGAFGSALADVLRENHHAITFYDPIKFPNISFPQVISQVEIFLIAIPSHIIPNIAPLLAAYDQPLILATKGLLSLDYFVPHPVSLISGGAFAQDLLAKNPTTLTGTDPLVRSLFETSWLGIQLTPDTTGVMLCGTLANIYALGAGFLASPPNYVQKSLPELKIYLKKHGASPTTADLSCGIGDLQLKCTDSRSRNFQFGANFHQQPGQPLTTTVEGLSTLATLDDYTDYPILNAIHDIFAGDPEAPIRLAELTT